MFNNLLAVFYLSLASLLLPINVSLAAQHDIKFHFTEKPDRPATSYETVVLFLHGMGESGEFWHGFGSQVVEGMYKDEVKKGTLEGFEKGTVRVVFADGIFPSTWGLGVSNPRDWFELPRDFKSRLQQIKCKEGLLEFLNPEGTGLSKSVSLLRQSIQQLLDEHELTIENLILVGYSQGGMTASKLAQELPGSCQALILINAPFVPVDDSTSLPAFTYMTYGQKDNVIPNHVFEISIASLKEKMPESAIEIKTFSTRHDINPDQLPWILGIIDDVIGKRKANF